MALKPSNSDSGAIQWLAEIAETNAILSAILRVMHPDQFQAGKSALEKLRGQPDLAEVLDKWSSVFTGVAVISNRITPGHRDTGGRLPWYDLLATVGNYHDAEFELSTLGIKLRYNPGTVIAVAGKTLEHGMPSFKGERVCYAFFMKESVHERMRVEAPGWMTHRYYQDLA